MPYIGKGANGFGIRERYRYSASGSQTAFTGSDLDSKTLQFDSGSLLDVYLNGVLLDTADYNTSTANTVTLTSGATASDEVMIVVYDVFSLSDAMPKTGGTFTGAVTHTGAFTSVGIDDNADATAITIDSSEKVGIGTTTPSQLLNLQASTNPVIQISTLSDSNPTDAGALDIVEKQSSASSTATFGQNGVYGFRTILNGSDNTLRIKSGSQTTVNDRVTIERDTGNVGINTTSPDAKLDVEGTTDAEVRITRTTASTATTFNDAGSVLNLVNNVNYENGYNGGASIGQILFTSNDSSTGAGVRAKISCKATTYYHAERLQFFVSPPNTASGQVSATSNTDGLRMEINDDGTVKIGVDLQPTAWGLRVYTTPGNSSHASIEARNNTTGGFVFKGLNHNGSLSSSISQGGVGYFPSGVSSDETLKNVKGVMNDGWSKLKDVEPKSFTWKKITTETNEEGEEVEVKSDDDLDGNIHYGVMAQDLKKVIPELAYGEEGGMSVDYNGLLMIAINTIKELEARIKALEEA